MKSALCLLVLVLVGCATHVIHPGAINKFDSQAYDTLMSIQASIEQASKEVAAFPQFKQFKPELNKVIDGYNAAQSAYKAYHEAAAAGKPTDQPAFERQLQALSAAVASIVHKLRPTDLPPNPAGKPFLKRAA